PSLIAGIIPGLLVALALVITITVLITFNSSSAPRGETSSGREKLLSLAGLLPVAGLFVLVVGLVFLGVTTATEAAAVGCLGALALMLGRTQLTSDRKSLEYARQKST